MPANDRQRDMEALRALIDEACLVVSTAELPEGRSKRAVSLLEAARSLADDLIERPPDAVAIGQRGGLKTAERGSDYYRQIAAKRKTHAGGKPKNPTN